MDVSFPTDSKELREFNFIRYKGMPPSLDLIRKVIEKSRLKRQVRFERVWGIPKGTIRLYLNGHRELPLTYWHIFYDFDTISQKYRKKIKPLQKKRTISSTDASVLEPNKAFIDDFKHKQSTR